MIDPEQFKFENALSLTDAQVMTDALDEALTAMAHFGSITPHMSVISALHLVAKREAASALKAHKMISAPKEAK